MSLLDSYLSSIRRKQEELVHLKNDLARESDKKASQSAKIASAHSAMSRTSSLSTIKSKASEIERAQKELSNIEKKIADINKKIASKEKDLASENKKYYDEQAREQKKQLEANKKFQQTQERQMQNVNTTLFQNSHEHDEIRNAIAELQNLPETITVLFMASNPTDTNHLRLDEEARAIQEMIRKSEYRDAVRFESRWAVQPLDLLQSINEVEPTIIHFSGHGADNGALVLQSPSGAAKLVSKEAITQTIMAASDQIRLIFFNACFSHAQADAVIRHVDAAIGMTEPIGDEAAKVFAAQFYSALGFGLSVQKAFDQAKAALLLEGIQEENTPKLYVRDGLNASDIIIVRPGGTYAD